MPDATRIIEIDDCRQLDWDEFVYGCNESAQCHLYGWRRICRDYFAHETFYLACLTPDDTVQGVMPLVSQKSMIFGKTMRSMPYVNYGGAVSNSPKIELLLMERARDLATSAACKVLECRDAREKAIDWICRRDKVAMLLELPQSVDELGNALGSKIRSQIRRPQRHDPDIQIGGSELLDTFYDLFSQNMRNLGTPVYPKGFFERVCAEFNKDTKIICIFINHEPAAAAFLIGFRDSMEIPWAASRAEYKSIGVNMLLYWEALRYSIQAGYRTFDFGRSSRDGGTYRFKKQWGAKELPLHWYLFGEGATTDAPVESGVMKVAVSIWRKLPLAITNRVGPLLAKQLPW